LASKHPVFYRLQPKPYNLLSALVLYAKVSQLPSDCSLHHQAALINKAAFAGCLHRAAPRCFPRARPGSTHGGICGARAGSPSSEPSWKPSQVQGRRRENSMRKNQPVRGMRREHACAKKTKTTQKMIGICQVRQMQVALISTSMERTGQKMDQCPKYPQINQGSEYAVYIQPPKSVCLQSMF